MESVRIDDAEYPLRLRNIPSPPEVLYYLGKLPSMERPAVSIVGSRGCSEYGRQMAALYGAYLATHGVDVISGMAIGIDGEAQRAAIMAGGKSYGVLAGGADICYPRSNRPLYESLQKNGGLIAEHPAGTKPLSVYFPSRNRIISGLSDLVLVIEAKERSGTGYTVRMALEQGREVYAIPGRVTDALSCGCNRLIAEGAGVAESPEIVLGAARYAWELNRDAQYSGQNTEERKNERRGLLIDNRVSTALKAGVTYADLSPDEVRILQLLREKERTADELALQGGFDGMPHLLVILLGLERKGVIEKCGGLYFSKVV